MDSLGKIRRDEGRLIVTFGRHKGRSINEIQSSEPSYVGWLLSPSGIECEATKDVIREHLAS